jgi:DNA-directed RNA polymerase subunit omega
LRIPPGGTPIAEFDVLRSKVDSTFHLVHLAAKRAREINGYYAHLGEGLTQYIPPLMAVDSDKPLSIALEEIAAEKVVAVEPSGDEVVDPLSFIDMGDEDPATTLSLITGEGDVGGADTEDVEPA